MKKKILHGMALMSAQRTAHYLMAHGLKCYCVAGCWYILWLPWENKAIGTSDTQAIKRHLGLTDGRFASEIAFQCLLHRSILQVPHALAQQFPMPQPAFGSRYAGKKDMLKWLRTILPLIP
ncbi:MAG: hypothetical protein KDB65_12125 [Calditrichaeota bacterium]|nr:hypothetical protein [Calditrichota bacterium]MCB9367560.1 hypothetical protein [Calditrichota bacterium]